MTSARDDQATNADRHAGLPFRLTAETRSAIEAVQFVAAHLKNEDDYAEVTVQYRPCNIIVKPIISKYPSCPDCSLL